MLEQQLRSQRKPATRDAKVGSDEPMDSVSRQQRQQDGASDFTSNLQVIHKVNLPKPSRDIGVGDGNVFVVEASTVGDVGPVRIHEREVSTEQNTEVKEKEIKTVFLRGGASDTSSMIGGYPQTAVKQTRSIGVGDDLVYEVPDPESSRFEVREKELRTVYIDGADTVAAPLPKSTRNVGILCKAAMREVGVMYHSDDAAPMTRNIAVGAGEMGVGADGYAALLAADAERSDTSVNITNMALQQLNMAAFQSRHLRFSNEQLREVLDMMLKKNLRSVAVQCRFATVDRAVSTTATAAENSATVGCSDDTIDVDVVPIRQFRSTAIDCRPSVFHRACGADFVYRVDSATNTRTQGIRVDRASNTDAVVKYPAATNTDSRVTGKMMPMETESTVKDVRSGGDDVSRQTRTTMTSEVKKTASPLQSTPTGSGGNTVSTETEYIVRGSGGGGGGDMSSRQVRTTITTEVKKTSSSPLMSASSPQRAAAAISTTATGDETGDDTSNTGSMDSTSDLARQRKRNSMLFGDEDEPPLIVAGSEHYHQSDTALSTSSTSVGSSSVGGSRGSAQLFMPSRTVSEPTFSQTASSSSRESFMWHSDDPIIHTSPRPQHPDTDEARQHGKVVRGHQESSDGDGSGDTLCSVVLKHDTLHPDSSTTLSHGGGGGSGRQVYVTETRIERRHTGPEVSSAAASEGSIRSIMKSSSSSDKDTSSPTVTRRIKFMDSSQHRRFVVT